MISDTNIPNVELCYNNNHNGNNNNTELLLLLQRNGKVLVCFRLIILRIALHIHMSYWASLVFKPQEKCYYYIFYLMTEGEIKKVPEWKSFSHASIFKIALIITIE